MKYKVDVTLEGSIEIEAESPEKAREQAEDGFSIDQFNCEEVEINEIQEMA